jgi:hypothetical protein
MCAGVVQSHDDRAIGVDARHGSDGLMREGVNELMKIEATERPVLAESGYYKGN